MASEGSPSVLHDIFGKCGVAVLSTYLQRVQAGEPRQIFETVVARERNAAAQAELVEYFGPRVEFDASKVNVYGKKAKIGRVATSSTKHSSGAHVVRFPVVQPNRQILHMDPKPFDASTETPLESNHRNVYTPFNVIRQRLVNGQAQGNARVVRWSNGDTTLHIGTDVYAMEAPTRANDPHYIMRRETFTQENCEAGDGIVEKRCEGLWSTGKAQGVTALRLATPLEASSVGKALAAEKAQKQRSRRLEYVVPKVRVSQQGSSRAFQQRPEITDEREDLVIDMLARDSAENVSPAALEAAIAALERGAESLGVVDSGELRVACAKLSQEATKGADARRHAMTQCTNLRHMYNL